jgi:hypothetical protein
MLFSKSLFAVLAVVIGLAVAAPVTNSPVGGVYLSLSELFIQAS